MAELDRKPKTKRAVHSKAQNMKQQGRFWGRLKEKQGNNPNGGLGSDEACKTCQKQWPM